MSAADVRIAAARGEALARRQALVATIEEIKAKLAPNNLAHDAWEGAKGKGSELADSTLTAAKQRPGMVAGVAAGVALLIARKPLYALVSGLFEDEEETSDHRDKE